MTPGADTSNFLRWTKLKFSSFQAGTDDERTVTLSQVNALKPITSGSIEVNGTSIHINRNGDSLKRCD